MSGFRYLSEGPRGKLRVFELSGKPRGGSQVTGGLASGAPSSVAASPHPRRFQQGRTGRGRERARERKGKREGGKEGGKTTVPDRQLDLAPGP